MYAIKDRCLGFFFLCLLPSCTVNLPSTTSQGVDSFQTQSTPIPRRGCAVRRIFLRSIEKPQPTSTAFLQSLATAISDRCLQISPDSSKSNVRFQRRCSSSHGFTVDFFPRFQNLHCATCASPFRPKNLTGFTQLALITQERPALAKSPEKRADVAPEMVAPVDDGARVLTRLLRRLLPFPKSSLIS
ncbi:hypothetical protein U1Q18_011345 [Sarracenia purpurea var. burkii]